MQNTTLSQEPEHQLSSAAPNESNTALVTDPYLPEKSGLANLCGISNTELAGAVVNQALATFSRYDPDKKNISLAVAALREIAPKDTFEGMLAAQMPAFCLALYTGMRLGEIHALKWDCVDLVTQQITVKRTYCIRTHRVKEWTNQPSRSASAVCRSMVRCERC